MPLCEKLGLSVIARFPFRTTRVQTITYDNGREFSARELVRDGPALGQQGRNNLRHGAIESPPASSYCFIPIPYVSSFRLVIAHTFILMEM